MTRSPPGVGNGERIAFSVPFVDLVGQHAPLKPELLAAVGSVIDRGQFILGDEVAEFEERFAEICGVSHAVGVNSGTDALILALRALGVRTGDDVITVPNSFVASTACIRLVGARPVFVDVGEDYNIDPAKLKAALTPRTKVVVIVHLTGHPCDMDPIMKIATENGVYVVEDCAQAVLAEYKGRRVGSFGTIGCFSLHPLKTLNACGDGGALTTSDPTICEQLKTLRNIGLRTREDCVTWSHNSRLDTIQAAMLMVKLRYLMEWTERRRQNAAYYLGHLHDLPQVQLPRNIQDAKSVYHTFVVQVEQREDLRRYLRARGIGTAVHYPVPIHLTSAGRELGYPEGSFPVAERQASRILSLPVHQGLSAVQLGGVCESLCQFYSQQ